MKALITAGPTREHIDDVRYITNPSTGLMGISLARKGVERGWEVTLVLGPTHLEPPKGVKTIKVVSAEEMISKVLEELTWGYDIVISAAALADYTPEKKHPGKIRSGGELTISLRKTPKLIQKVRSTFPSIGIVAFKAEYGGTETEQIASARKLLEFADFVVLNDISKGVFGSNENEATILSKDGEARRLNRDTKENIAAKILEIVSS